MRISPPPDNRVRHIRRLPARRGKGLRRARADDAEDRQAVGGARAGVERRRHAAGAGGAERRAAAARGSAQVTPRCSRQAAGGARAGVAGGAQVTPRCR